MQRQGFVHRDIKADNITLDANFEIKLIDFGFATQFDDTLLSDSLGSGCYRAPEIIDNEPYCPLKVDVFAIGVTLYFLMTGNYPWFEASRQKNIHYKEIARGKSNLFWRVRASDHNNGKQFDPLLTNLLDKMWHLDPR